MNSVTSWPIFSWRATGASSSGPLTTGVAPDADILQTASTAANIRCRTPILFLLKTISMVGSCHIQNPSVGHKASWHRPFNQGRVRQKSGIPGIYGLLQHNSLHSRRDSYRRIGGRSPLMSYDRKHRREFPNSCGGSSLVVMSNKAKVPFICLQKAQGTWSI